jgi:transposase
MEREECKNCPLIEEVKYLRKRIEELEAKLAKYEKPEKHSGNSSLPPSTDRKKKYPAREKTGKKSGGQPGHEGITRKIIDNPDEIFELYPNTCPCCGGVDFHLTPQVKEVRQKVDIPKIQPIVTEYQQKAGICTKCGQKSFGEFPQRINAPVQIGERTEAIIGYLNATHHQGYDRIQRMLDDLFGLSISEGTVQAKLDNLKTLLKPEYDNILENLKNSKIIGSDSTGTRIEGKNAYLFTFQNDFYTYLKSVFSKAFKVIEDTIGSIFDGYWISDREAAQLKIQSEHQLCLSHLKRECKYIIEAEQSEWAKKLKQILDESIAFRKKRGNDFTPQNPDDFREAQKFKQRLLELFHTQPPKQDERKLFLGLAGRQEQILMFLKDKDVPYDNNGSERALRNSVIRRKVTGGFRTYEGAQTYDIIASVIETAKKKGRNILDNIILISHQNQLLLQS